MSLVEAIILGLAQGLTEFLPVSSSGHLVLLMSWFEVEEIGFLFNVVVHAASAGAILVFFLKLLSQLARKMWLAVLVGSVPAMVVGILIHEWAETLFSEPRLVGFALLVTAFFNLIIYWRLRQSQSEVDTEIVGEKEAEVAGVSWQQGLRVGLMQAVAIIPGVSRSGSTVMAGLVSGLSRQTAFRFSFMLALPAILGATLVESRALMMDSSVLMVDLDLPIFMVGAIASFVSSIFSLFLLRFMMTRAQFHWFALYTLLVGLSAIFLN